MAKPVKSKAKQEPEMVDVVDDQNNVLYKVTKQEAHLKGLLHRTVISEVIDKKGNFILTKQAPDKQDPGQYVSPVGGHARAGETEEEALKREAFEETGLVNFKYKLKGRFIFNRFVIGRQENHMFFVYEIYSNNRLRLNAESVSYERFTIDEIKETLSSNREKFGGAFIAVLEHVYPEMLRRDRR